MSLKDRRRCAKFYFDHFYQIWRRGEPSEEVGLDGLKIGKLPPLSPLSRNHEKNIIVVSNFVRSIFRSFQKEILSLFEFHFQWREMGTNIQTYLPTYVRTYLIVTSKFGWETLLYQASPIVAYFIAVHAILSFLVSSSLLFFRYPFLGILECCRKQDFYMNCHTQKW